MESPNLSQRQMNYETYLTTDYWQQVSEAVKAKAGYRCQVCNSPNDLQAHHRTYAHRGRELEFLEDLTCLCDRCHSLFHKPAIEKKQALPKTMEMIELTNKNCENLRLSKESWRWLNENGLKPRKKGWKQRAIGRKVPALWLRTY